MPSHRQFNYYFEEDQFGTPGEGITFGEIHRYKGDLIIYYDSMVGFDYVSGRCSRWDVSDYTITFETWLDKTDLDTLRTYITPGAVGELFKILGRPTYYDKTWNAENTIKIVPYDNNTSNLHNMRKETVLYVKNVTEHPIQDTDYIEIKIEGLISGSQSL